MRGASRADVGPVNAFAARLMAIAAIFALAVLLQLRALGPYSEEQLTALYALVLAGFLLSLSYGVLAIYGRSGPRLLACELIGDGLLITAFVYCSGGVGSLFAFLFIVWLVHAVLRAGSRAAVYACGAATASYAAVALGTASGWLPPFEGTAAASFDETVTAFGIHTAAFVSVTLLARRLARRVEIGQSELIELGELQQRIVDNVSSGLLTVTDNGHIRSFNREAERITDCRAEDVVGWELGRLFPALEEALLGAAESERAGPLRGEVPFARRDGEELQLGFSRSTLRDAAGRPDGAILIFQDLTRVREMEERLRRSERLSAVGQLATGLAHEIRNPLASLSGAIELLGVDLRSEEASSRKLLRIVERETARLNRLVSDFLSYAGGREPRRERVVLAELFEEIEVLLGSGEHAHVRLEIEVPAGLAVIGDSDQLRQVFWNLILNAAEAKPPDDRVRVRAAALPPAALRSPHVGIEIEDRGSGIPPEALERAFEPFFTTKPQGTGLGLATVHRVVEAHGGELSVSSEPGKGTLVGIVLEQEES